MSSTCFAGRMVFGRMEQGGRALDPRLDWERPCPVPPECRVPTTPPMYFCCPHYDAVMEHLYDMFERLGLIDYRIGPPDEFDRLVQQLGED